MQTGKKIIDVVPLTRLPLSGNQVFSYFSQNTIARGSLVSISLFKREVEGIVWQSRPDFPKLGKIQIKNIKEIIAEDFLDEKQLALAEFMADYYFSSLGSVLKLFVPKRTKSRNPQPITYNPQSLVKNEIVLTKEQQIAVDKITKKDNRQSPIANRQFLLFGPAGSGKTEVYINSILKLRQQNPAFQFLILLPEIMLVPQAIERYGMHFKSEEIAVINSKLSKGKLFVYWQKIKSGEIKLIIGSRMAIFLPFQKLGLIVIDEEQDISFKQWDMHPRYDARRVAEKLSEIHQSRLLFGSATPRVETYFKAKNKKGTLLKLPFLNLPKVKFFSPDIFLADMRKEKWKNWNGQSNSSCLSRKLQAEISYALKNKLQSLLFINRQGMSNFSVCNDCKTVLKCSHCERALIYDKGGFYKCLHCNYKSSILPECSHCQGSSFKNIGLGTQKVEKETAELFPSARIARIDNQTMQKSGSEEKIFKDFSAGKIDILIGTQMISKGWDLPNLALVGIIDADNLLHSPDFLASEKAFQDIMQLVGRTNRPGAVFRGMAVIQTFNPENYLLKTVLEKKTENFLEQELTERKALVYPPFGKIIKLIFQDYTPEKVEKAVQSVSASLQKIISAEIKISEGHAPLVSKIRGRYRKQIILKLRQTELPTELLKIIKQLPANWIVDVDPIGIA
jgi:primosomal protein N' (replication factor Y) (superfamily II helicase)